jgi:hypothetical protein
MKTFKLLMLAALLLAASVAGLTTARAGEDPKPKVKPYTLTTCAVCDMKLGSMGKPYVFTYQDREIKVCEKAEEAEFKKDPAKYLKKIETAEAKAKTKPAPKTQTNGVSAH